METRFGRGEYERTDVEVRSSTADLRSKVLQALVNRKGFWAKDLLRVVNYDLLPEKLRKDFPREELLAFFIAHLFTVGSNKTAIAAIYVDTPIHHFFAYLSAKSPVLELLTKEAEDLIRNHPHRGSEIEKRALKMLIPDWKTLYNDPQGAKR